MNITVSIEASSKDSVTVTWTGPEVLAGMEYIVRYRAEESTVVQESHPLMTHSFIIQQLHEDTMYEVCVQLMKNSTVMDKCCVPASTVTDSLTLALGSTFGAFLALSLIVLLVAIAKLRRDRRHAAKHNVPSQEAEEDVVYVWVGRRYGSEKLPRTELTESQRLLLRRSSLDPEMLRTQNERNETTDMADIMTGDEYDGHQLLASLHPHVVGGMVGGIQMALQPSLTPDIDITSNTALAEKTSLLPAPHIQSAAPGEVLDTRQPLASVRETKPPVKSADKKSGLLEAVTGDSSGTHA